MNNDLINSKKINLDDYSEVISVLFKIVSCKGKLTTSQLKIELEKQLDKLLEIYSDDNILPKEIVNENIKKQFIDELAYKYSIEYGVEYQIGPCVISQDNIPWVENSLKNGKLKFNNYKKYESKVLKLRRFSKKSIEHLDEVTTKILDYIGDPKKTGKKFGLLMGDVQSGKTLTFTGILHKAIDAGYRFVVVLAGMTNSLRVQTQNRLNSDLVGITTKVNGKRVSNKISNNISFNLLTSSDSDFKKNKTDSVIAVDDDHQITLAIVKKNQTVLKNLIEWLEDVKALGVDKLPLIMIDDEADNASVNGKKKEEDPAKINKQIRQILDYFERSSYIAVTATPFANIFIDPQIDPKTKELTISENELFDLFPRDFIYALNPPKGYLGVERLFGNTAELERNSVKYKSVIPITYQEDTDETSCHNQIYQGKLKKPDDLYALPDSLINAVYYFCCICTFQDLNVTSENLSMLVHIARFTKIQNKLCNMIQDKIVQLFNHIDLCWNRSDYCFDSDKIYQQLQTIWNIGIGNELYYSDESHGDKPETLNELSGLKWESVAKKRFLDTLKTIKVVTVNSDSDIKNTAVYYENNDARIIAIGGNSLSRGLTLEGLCVSYFSRRSPAYDTLLQMGRWFGYRERYVPFMKIWISDCLIYSYKIIADAVSEFRDTVLEMCRNNRSPKDFGLRIKCAPSVTKMVVTAACKRRTSKKISTWLDIAGFPFQAGTFPVNETDRKYNLNLLSSFLKHLGKFSRGKNLVPDAVLGADDLVWSGISASVISDLIQSLKVPSWSYYLNPIKAADEIRKRNEEWSVRVLSFRSKSGDSSADVFDLGDQAKIYLGHRRFYVSRSYIDSSRKSVISEGDFARHWDIKKINSLKKAVNGDEDTIRNSRVFSEIGERPQLLVYALKPVEFNAANAFISDEILTTIAFGLPRNNVFSTSKIKVQYETNQIYQMFQDDGYITEEDDE